MKRPLNYNTGMKRKILYVVLASISALGVGAAVTSDALSLGVFDSTAATTSDERMNLGSFDSFAWLRTGDRVLSRFNSNPVKGLLLTVR